MSQDFYDYLQYICDHNYFHFTIYQQKKSKKSSENQEDRVYLTTRSSNCKWTEFSHTVKNFLRNLLDLRTLLLQHEDLMYYFNLLMQYTLSCSVLTVMP